VHVDRVALQTTQLGNANGLHSGTKQEGGYLPFGPRTLVNWGRWTGGYPITGVTDPQTGYFQYAQVVPNGDLKLPTSGTFEYRPITFGNTALLTTGPTSGNAVGRLVDLIVGVDFTNSSITRYDLTASVGGSTWSAGLANPSASNLIADFTGRNGIRLSGTCTGCGSGASPIAATGTALGQFFGPSGQGLITGYGLSAQSSTLTGTAVLFRR
jgi:hypothetical protein